MDADEPKKYIRTFAGDMAKLQEGGTPDLMPLKKPETSPAPPAPHIPPPVPAPAPTPIPEPPPQPSPEATAGTAPLPPAPPPQVPESIVEKTSPIETYASDFADKMKATSASPVTVLAAEQDAASGESGAPEPQQKSKSGVVYMIAGATLLVLGGLGVYFAYTYYLSGTAPVVSTPTISAPIFVDEREQISGTGLILLQAIQQSRNKSLANGAVRLLYTAEATASTHSTSSVQASSLQATTNNSVFNALQEPAPNVLLRNINAPMSMAGIVNAGGNQSPFFILSVTSYSNTFSGMLQWESSMPNDLGQLFPAYPIPVPVIATSSIATTTTTTTGKTKTKTATTTIATSTPIIPTAVASWHDETVNNHDVRIYRDALARSILLYGYWDQTTLIIARDPAAFTEILDRLANSHI